MVNGGSIRLSSLSITPSSGPIGTIFQMKAMYTVVHPTGPGLISFSILFPGGVERVGERDEKVNYGMAASRYISSFSFNSAQYSIGTYGVQFQICEGNCLHDHPYSGIYSQGTASFTITD